MNVINHFEIKFLYYFVTDRVHNLIFEKCRGISTKEQLEAFVKIHNEGENETVLDELQESVFEFTNLINNFTNSRNGFLGEKINYANEPDTREETVKFIKNMINEIPHQPGEDPFTFSTFNMRPYTMSELAMLFVNMALVCHGLKTSYSGVLQITCLFVIYAYINKVLIC